MLGDHGWVAGMSVDGLATLEELLGWCRATGAELVDVIVQDEYTHDVLVRERAGSYLVFDTT
jgi:hypothetical protein